ncbi:sulfite reductase [NADPH] flavoprotein component, partial [Linderina pennispora]
MASTLRSNTQGFASTAAAVVYTAATTLSSATGIVSDAAIVGDNATQLRQASEVAAYASDSEGVVSIVTAASTLVGLIPTLRDFARAKRPVAVHVPVSSASEVTDVLAVRDAGAAILRSSSAQQAVDYAVVASLTAQQLSLPVIHVFDQAADIEVNVYEKQAFAEIEAEGVYETVAAAMGLLGDYKPIVYAGAADASLVYVTFGAAATPQGDAGAVQIGLYRPLNNAALLAAIPETAARVVALEQAVRQPTPWGPLLFDLAALLHSSEWDDARTRPVLIDGVSSVAPASLTSEQVAKVTAHAAQFSSPAHFSPAELLGIDSEPVGNELAEGLSADEQQQRVSRIPYGQLLRDVFKQRLHVANAAEST